jgi:hypothetical protein
MRHPPCTQLSLYWWPSSPLVTVVGIPLGLCLLAALLLIYALGYSATGWILGRSILGRPTAWVVTAFLAGWAILRVIALVLILGGLTWFAAVVFGLGALAVAIWRPVAPAKPPPQRRLTLAAGPCVSGAEAAMSCQAASRISRAGWS